jgi:hypothetical protein
MGMEREDQRQPDSRRAASTLEGEGVASGSEPSDGNLENSVSDSDLNTRAYAHEDIEVSEVWAAATEQAMSKERSAKERKAHMPRLRFRLRQYEKYPRLDVSTTGAVTNFMGLSLQATNPANFMWDTIYKRSERQITCTEENAMELLTLYDSLASLKERHHFQSGGRTPGPLAAVLENVLFTDHTDTFDDNVAGQEWTWAADAALGSPALRHAPSSASHRDSLSARVPGGPGERTSSMRGLAHSPREHNLTPPISPLRKQISSDESSAQHTKPLAMAAVSLDSPGRHHRQRQKTLRTGLYLPPAGASGSFDGGDYDQHSLAGDRVLGLHERSGDNATTSNMQEQAAGDVDGIVHENPLAMAAAAAGAVPFETAQQGHTPPLFNVASLVSREDSDEAQSYGAGDHRYDDLDAAADSDAEAGTAVQGTPRQVPLFMAAMEDDTDNDLGRDDGVARAVSPPVRGGGGGSLSRAGLDANSEAVFELEVQRPMQQVARQVVHGAQPAQGTAAEAQSDVRQSAPSDDSESESELV